MSWKFAIIPCFLLFFSACKQDDTLQVPQVDHLDITVHIKRFERNLFALDTNRMEEALIELEEAYPEFGNVFFTYVLNSKNPQIAPQGHAAYVKGFLQHPGVKKLYDTTQVSLSGSKGDHP